MNDRDLVRVVRVIEYVGDRKFVESVVKRAIHGQRHINGIHGLSIVISGTTLTEFPDILSDLQSERFETMCQRLEAAEREQAK